MALRNHKLPFGLLNNVFGEVDEEIFQGVQNQYYPIFCIFGIEKSDLDKSD
jgi:hypothetical protein